MDGMVHLVLLCVNLTQSSSYSNQPVKQASNPHHLKNRSLTINATHPPHAHYLSRPTFVSVCSTITRERKSYKLVIEHPMPLKIPYCCHYSLRLLLIAVCDLIFLLILSKSFLNTTCINHFLLPPPSYHKIVLSPPVLSQEGTTIKQSSSSTRPILLISFLPLPTSRPRSSRSVPLTLRSRHAGIHLWSKNKILVFHISRIENLALIFWEKGENQ